MNCFAPFSLDSLFPGFNSWLHDVCGRVLKTTLVSPFYLDPERNKWERDGWSRTRSLYSYEAATKEESWLAPQALRNMDPLVPPHIVDYALEGGKEKTSSCPIYRAPSYGEPGGVLPVSDLSLFSVLRRSHPTAFIPDLQPHSHLSANWPTSGTVKKSGKILVHDYLNILPAF